MMGPPRFEYPNPYQSLVETWGTLCPSWCVSLNALLKGYWGTTPSQGVIIVTLNGYSDACG